MPNLAIAIKGSDEIHRFIRDATIRGKKIVSGNGGSITLKPELFDFRWTGDAASPVLDADGGVAGFDRKMSELSPGAKPREISPPTRADLRRAVDEREFLAGMTYGGIDAHIDRHVTDLETAKGYLKKVSRAVLALARMVDAHDL